MIKLIYFCNPLGLKIILKLNLPSFCIMRCESRLFYVVKYDKILWFNQRLYYNLNVNCFYIFQRHGNDLLLSFNITINISIIQSCSKGTLVLISTWGTNNHLPNIFKDFFGFNCLTSNFCSMKRYIFHK